MTPEWPKPGVIQGSSRREKSRLGWCYRKGFLGKVAPVFRKGAGLLLGRGNSGCKGPEAYL